MKKINLDLKDNGVNEISIQFNYSSHFSNGRIFIQFFEPGRMSNAYTEGYGPIQFKNENNKYQFTSSSPLARNLKLYLPMDKKYSLNVDNTLGYCSVKNGKLYSIHVTANDIYIENVEAKGNISSYNWMNMSDITLVDSHIENVNGTNMDISNSHINHLHVYSSAFSANVKDSSIHKFSSDDTKMNHFSHARTTMVDSTIENINYKDAYLNLVGCKVGNVISSGGQIDVSNCKFIKRSRIELYKDCHLFLGGNNEYSIKKTPLGRINIYSNKEKQAKILVNRGKVFIQE